MIPQVANKFEVTNLQMEENSNSKVTNSLNESHNSDKKRAVLISVSPKSVKISQISPNGEPTSLALEDSNHNKVRENLEPELSNNGRPIRKCRPVQYYHDEIDSKLLNPKSKPKSKSKVKSIKSSPKKSRSPTLHKPIKFESIIDEANEQATDILKNIPKDEQEFTHLQSMRCQNNKYAEFRKCKSCIAKQMDICRFVNTRLFKTKDGQLIYGPHFIKNDNYEKFRNYFSYTSAPGLGKKKKIIEEPFIPPNLNVASFEKYDNDINLEIIDYISYHLRKATSQILKKDEKFYELHKENIHIRPLIAPLSQNCDNCRTGIFNFFYMCRMCGKELCIDCYNSFEEYTEKRHYNCFKDKLHNRSLFIPFSNYPVEVYIKLIDSLKEDIPTPAFVQEEYKEFKDLLVNCDSSIYRSYHKGNINQITFEKFQYLWTHGQPMVMILDLTKAKYKSDPKFFIKYYGDEMVDILYLKTNNQRSISVKHFFEGFLNPEKGFLNNKQQQIPIKIKDWPSTTAFKDYFPTLNADFMNLVPFKSYMRYDGVFNLVSHLPKETYIIPDLGPKMYNSFPSLEGSKIGTTNLHMDAADAINIMMYSSGEMNSPGAVWHLFAREDVPKLREFMLEEMNIEGKMIDPIHDQSYYLTPDLLQLLYDKKGVKSFKIYQKPGEAVLIPAGVPHQVQNLNHCIKTAMDFVAPESAEICFKLSNEFRNLPNGHSRNIDILNSISMITNGWNSIYKKRKMNNLDKGKEESNYELIYLPSTVVLNIKKKGNHKAEPLSNDNKERRSNRSTVKKDINYLEEDEINENFKSPKNQKLDHI